MYVRNFIEAMITVLQRLLDLRTIAFFLISIKLTDGCMPLEENYVYCAPSVNRTTAALTCELMGYRLLQPRSKSDFDKWVNYMSSVQVDALWVGAQYNKTYNGFVWDGTSSTVPSAYFRSTTTATCVSYESDSLLYLISLSYLFESRNCKEMKDFICENIPDQTTVDPTTAPPSAAPPTTAQPLTAAPTTASPTTAPSTIGSSVTTLQTATTPTTTAPSTTAPPLISALTTEQPTTAPLTSPLTNAATATSNDFNVSTLLSTIVTPSNAITGLSTLINSSSMVTTLLTTASSLLTVAELWEVCSCGCPLNIPTDLMLKKTFVDEIVQEIQRKLYVDIETLSATVRKKTSAEDNRPTAQTVGCVGIVVLVFVFGSIMVMDLTICCRVPKSKKEKTKDKPDSGKDKVS